MLALSTCCRTSKEPLDRSLVALRASGAPAFALHRAPTAEEARGIASLRTFARVAAVFGAPGADVGCRLYVVEGPKAGPDRERSLEEFCRTLHRWRDLSIAVRTPPDGEHHPSPAELPLLREALRNAGYWHDPDRGGAEFLDVGAPFLLGASFDPLRLEDLRALRDALPAAAAKVIELAAGAGAETIRDALSRARGVFGG